SQSHSDRRASGVSRFGKASISLAWAMALASCPMAASVGAGRIAGGKGLVRRLIHAVPVTGRRRHLAASRGADIAVALRPRAAAHRLDNQSPCQQEPARCYQNVAIAHVIAPVVRESTTARLQLFPERAEGYLD